MADDKQNRFRGGRQTTRDVWYGLQSNADFPRFRDWWHCEGKFAYGSDYISTRSRALAVYRDWIELGRP